MIIFTKIMYKIKYFLNNFQKTDKEEYRIKLAKLIPELEDHMQKNKSCGASYSDYFHLYDYIIKFKPKYILECGSGITSYIIAKALQKNHHDYKVKGLCVSMEEQPQYFEDIKKNFPDSLNEYMNFNLSNRIEKKYSFYCGVGYKDIPKFDYEFVFIDGPNTVSPTDGIRKFDFDLITAIQMSTKPITCYIDHRLSTTYCYQNIFTKKKVKYDLTKNIGIVRDVSQNDLIMNWDSSNFKFNFFDNEIMFNTISNNLKNK